MIMAEVGTAAHTLRAAVDAGALARRAASGRWRFWRSALAQQWSALGSTVEAEISVRATMMARSGVGAVPELVGRSRAALLGDLGVPRSTSELSRRHGLAPATVSYHLGVLLRAGLVTRVRERNLVYYRRNAPADALLGDALDGRRQPPIRATGR